MPPANRRQVCARCDRPPCVCYCAFIPSPKLVTQFKVHCIQHPNEFKRKALSSVPVLGHALESMSLEVTTTSTFTVGENESVLLLFPGSTATVLTSADLTPNLTLVVVDGTWKEAKQIVQRDPTLRALRRVVVQSTATSLYGTLRREPMEGCLSTLEAVAAAISVLEGQTSTETTLLSMFQQVVALQQEYVHAGVQRNLSFYDGVPKPARVLQEVAVTVPEALEDGESHWYEVYLTQHSVSGIATTSNGDRFFGTHSQAIGYVAALNAGRVRGHRFGVRRFHILTNQSQG
ncbi:hypothetical protein H257_05022 [Aphanomyces astaci]|uniref:tRNA-uridine aminocarboxypropyltransferase n=1 Tax=Aphanomyces astaci TaxID=112090 RepID=W4GTM6_APHAT|nr:hypothetical protein H257_05022 [Aphanomyces astaci]ETV82369.1 hypothetical protein H257_05022 [Aphanomyces astaci]RQM21506.1 hypothetical protein B5M09_009729 [Aphanomyces astaci]|eukprot:XP_009828038.1 hypothetical protein H257_05022 [Aphanomyces astaci]